MNAGPHRLQIAGSDIAFECSPQDTVLRAAQRAGLAFPYECNVGSCGTCKFELIDGEVQVDWPQAPGWTDKDRQRRRHLGCQTRPQSPCTVKVRLMEPYAPVHRPTRTAATLTGWRDLTHDLREFQFELDHPQAFEPGQYALCWMPDVVGPRAWSMSNVALPGSPTRRWEFQVRRVPTGHGSEVLFGLTRGARVEFDGPYGMAWLRREAPRDILCLAGGSGLALSLIHI